MHTKKKLPEGVIVPLLTPRLLSDLPPLIDYVLAGGVSALFILGTTGETLELDQKTRLEVIRQTAKHLQQKVPFIVGLAASHLNESIELMRLTHEEGGAAGVLIPHFWQTNSEEVVRKILDCSPGDLLLYNNPALTHGQFLPIDQIEKLSQEVRILGIKDSSGDLEYLEKLLEIKKERGDFQIYYGPGFSLEQVLHKDIDGLISGYANFNPYLVVKMWKEKGIGLQQEWDDLRTQIKESDQENYILGFKRLLKASGLLSSADLWYI